MSVDELAVPGVRGLVPYVPGKPVEELERELGIRNIVKLASNENPLGTNPGIAQALQAQLSELPRYPDGGGYRLKKALAGKFGVEARQITLGNGSNEILELVARTFLSPGLEVVFSQHAFAVYPLVTQAVGATARVVKALNYGHDLKAMRSRINTKTRLIFIANPNNPTGTLLSSQELEAFIADLPPTVLCVLDEAYFEYIDPVLRSPSVEWLVKYPNLIITRTFSKAYGLAGLRIGYSLSSPEIADLLNRIRQPFNNNMLALTAAEYALSDLDYLNKTIAANNDGMEYLTAIFRQMKLSWIPSSGNFVSVDVGREALPVYQSLLQRGVIVRPVANYEMPNHLRVSIGTEQENSRFAEMLKRVLTDV